jgi:hypothetical protein
MTRSQSDPLGDGLSVNLVDLRPLYASEGQRFGPEVDASGTKGFLLYSRHQADTNNLPSLRAIPLNLVFEQKSIAEKRKSPDRFR